MIDLDPRTNRTYHYWHAFVPDVTAGQLYGYRVAGPFDPTRGLRFDPNKVLLDPYGKCIARPAGRSREAARQPGDNAATALRSVVVDPSTYDWEGDTPPICARMSQATSMASGGGRYLQRALRRLRNRCCMSPSVA